MDASRLTGIPLDHVVAEAAAFPLATEEAFALGLTGLDPTMQDKTQQLWRAAERHLLGGFPAFSVEEIVALRDDIWFGKTAPRTHLPLHTYLCRLAERVLEVHGTSARPQYPLVHVSSGAGHLAQAALARRLWRWLTLALPPDLLLAALHTTARRPQRIDALAPTLQRLLHDKQYAEAHLHIGAGLDFSYLWIATSHALARPDVGPEAFKSPGADFKEGRLLGPWLMLALLARYLLAAYLAWGRQWHDTFLAFLGSEVRTRMLVAGSAPGDFDTLLIPGLYELQHGQLAEETGSPGTWYAWQRLYAHLAGIAPMSFPSHLAQVPDADPVARVLPRRLHEHAHAEVRFIAAALAHLKAGADGLFSALFWQVVRVRVLFYRHIVQRPMTPGLQWFIRFYDRLSPARRPFNRSVQLEAAAELCGAGQGLWALEVRTSPAPDRSDMLTLVRMLDQAIPSLPRVHTPGQATPSRPLEVGLVLHFTKDRGGHTGKGRPHAHWQASYADPAVSLDDPASLSGYRYAAYYKLKLHEAEALAWLLRAYPLSLELIRGLDVCTDELGVPTWVLAPLLTRVRQAGEDAAASVQRLCGRVIPPLRTTVHAGEDFVHLLNGLRNIDEAIEGFHLGEGDRIGHGLALGVEPRGWARQTGRVPMAREDRLLDLVWEWSWYGRQGGYPELARLQRLEYEIADHTRAIFQEPILPYDLGRLVAALQQPDFLESTVSFTEITLSEETWRAPHGVHLYRYLTCPQLFQRGRQIVWVDTSTEGEALASLQESLRHKIGVRGLTVEVNPTSNLLVGNLGDLTTHPLWRLRSPRQGDGIPPVSVCIGSDDPVTFATDLRQEYQWLHDAMILAGLSSEEAQQWLDRTRACGVETRFTIDREPGHIFSLPSFS